MIKALLWDIDGTLLDFEAAEREAIRTLFREFGFGVCTDEMIARYSVINQEYWRKLERGEMEKPRILVERFRDFFLAEGLDASQASAFNERYQITLGDTIVFRDHSDRIVADLQGKIPQYGVTNGTKRAQIKKLVNSGLDQLLDDTFISDVIGYEKPDPRFFTPVLERLSRDVPGIRKEEILIIGDSLTSDMAGGYRTGLKTCWYNPKWKKGKEQPPFPIDHILQDLNQIYVLLKGEDQCLAEDRMEEE